MELQQDLEKKAVTISKVNVDETEFVLKLMLIRSGKIVNPKTRRGAGFRQLLIFIDEEGTKIQTTIPRKFSQHWRLPPSVFKVYYIMNGRIMKPTLTHSNVNKRKELSLTNATNIQLCNSNFSTRRFSDRFTRLENVKHINNRIYYDVVGILIETTELTEMACQKRIDVIIMDESYDRVRVILWEEHAIYDAILLENAQNCRTIVGFCNVRTTEFDGSLRFESDKLTSILVNPAIERARELLQWNRNFIERNIDITLTPSKQFRNAVPMQLLQMLDAGYDYPEIVFCKFDATIKRIDPKNNLCCGLCKICNCVVRVEGERKYCRRCDEYHAVVNYIYSAQLDLTTDSEDTEEEIIVTLGAQFLTGCKADKYMQSIAENGEMSRYYQKMIMSEGKRYTFMVRNYHKIPQSKRMREFEVEELHSIE